MRDLRLVIAILPAVLAVAGLLFCGMALVAASAFAWDQRRRAAAPTTAPSVSILKPVKGLDDGLLAALRSHCVQEYGGAFEVLCGVRSLDDAAVPVIRGLAAEFPHLRIEVIETPALLGANGKISNLVQMLPHARHELLLIADADIAVSRQYLQRVTAPFAQGKTGLVTALYRGRSQRSLGSRLESLGIATDFIPGVLTSRLLDRGLGFALGSTMLVSRPALAAAGGLEALVDVLADDHELGHRVAAAGFVVELASVAVSTAVPAYTLAGFWSHQLRWARTVRAVRPASYVGLICTQPVPWALVAVIACGANVWSLLLLVLAVLARVVVALRVGFGVLRDETVLRDLLLLPLRDCIACLVWIWSYAGDTVEWRGERFRVRGGRLIPLDRSAADLQ